jgi:hypothetical protein
MDSLPYIETPVNKEFLAFEAEIRTSMARMMLGRVSEAPLSEADAFNVWIHRMREAYTREVNTSIRQLYSKLAEAYGVSLGFDQAAGADKAVVVSMKDRRVTDIQVIESESWLDLKKLIREAENSIPLMSGEIGTLDPHVTVVSDPAMSPEEEEEHRRRWLFRKFMTKRVERRAWKRKAAARRRCGRRK